MTPGQLRRIASGKQIISGVYNYCNRWCEQCPFTRRCTVFLSHEAEGLTEPMENPEAEPPDMERSLEVVKDSFALTTQTIKESAEEQGLDWDQFVKEAMAAPRPKRRMEPPFIKEAMAYTKAVPAWLKSHKRAFQALGIELAQAVMADLPGRDPESEVELLRDAVDVISWYQYQIYVKLKRALGDEFDEEEEENNDLQSDRNGSARVALQGLDESIEAWETLRNDMPAVADDVLPVLASLSRIRKGTEKYFANARKFRRPGFDDPKFADLVRQFQTKRRK